MPNRNEKTRWVEWVEPFGVNNEPVYLRVKAEVAIARQRDTAFKARGYVYPTDEMALEDFITVHWATLGDSK